MPLFIERKTVASLEMRIWGVEYPAYINAHRPAASGLLLPLFSAGRHGRIVVDYCAAKVQPTFAAINTPTDQLSLVTLKSCLRSRVEIKR